MNITIKKDTTVNYRIDKLGWSLEDALTKDIVKGASKLCYDHLGNPYKSFKDMCEHYNKNYATVQTRLRKGQSLEDALTKEDIQSKPCHDHLGNLFKSFNSMCRYYNKNSVTVSVRINKLGWSLEDALTKDAIQIEICYDHLGNSYKSFNDMCKHYNKNKKTVEYRVKDLGWSLEEALTKDNTKCNSITIFNKRYNSISMAAKQYGILYGSIVKRRLNAGLDIELAFVLPTSECSRLIKYYIGIDNIARYKLGGVIYTTKELISKYAPQYLDLYNKTNPEGIYHPYIKE